MSLFAINLTLAIVCTAVGAIAAWLDKESPHRFFLAIVGALVGLIPLLAGIGYEMHHNLEVSNETHEFIHDRLDVLLNLPDETQREFVREYSSNSSAIKNLKNSFLARQSAAMENDFQGKYSQLAQGIIDVQAEQLMLMAMALTSEAKEEILATSLFSTDWKEKWSSEYWETQGRQIKQGIKIRRIFILNGQSMEQCESVFREHADAGVDVSFIDLKQLSVNEIKDLIIIDHALAAELLFTTDGRIVGGKVLADPKQVETYRTVVENIAARAVAYRPRLASRKPAARPGSIQLASR
jgi:hypothetical protein